MRNLITTLGMVIMCTIAMAQNEAHSNLDFENWVETPMGETPAGFFCFNQTKLTENVQHGDVALRIEVKDVPSAGLQGGIAVSGEMDMTTLDLLLGEPYTQRPEKLTGTYRYKTVETDSITISVVLFKTLNEENTPIASLNIVKTDDAEEWTEFSFPLQYGSTEIPDSILIGFSAGSLDGSNHVGTYLEIDNVKLEQTVSYTNAISANMDIDIFPNPTVDFININTENSIKEVSIFDCNGKNVYHNIPNNNTLKVNTSDLSKGVYCVRIVDANNKISNKKIIKN